MGWKLSAGVGRLFEFSLGLFPLPFTDGGDASRLS